MDDRDSIPDRDRHFFLFDGLLFLCREWSWFKATLALKWPIAAILCRRQICHCCVTAPRCVFISWYITKQRETFVFTRPVSFEFRLSLILRVRVLQKCAVCGFTVRCVARKDIVVQLITLPFWWSWLTSTDALSVLRTSFCPCSLISNDHQSKCFTGVTARFVEATRIVYKLQTLSNR